MLTPEWKTIGVGVTRNIWVIDFTNSCGASMKRLPHDALRQPASPANTQPTKPAQMGRRNRRRELHRLQDHMRLLAPLSVC
jgi:hypothetical protein